MKFHILTLSVFGILLTSSLSFSKGIKEVGVGAQHSMSRNYTGLLVGMDYQSSNVIIDDASLLEPSIGTSIGYGWTFDKAPYINMYVGGEFTLLMNDANAQGQGAVINGDSLDAFVGVDFYFKDLYLYFGTEFAMQDVINFWIGYRQEIGNNLIDVGFETGVYWNPKKEFSYQAYIDGVGMNILYGYNFEDADIVLQAFVNYRTYTHLYKAGVENQEFWYQDAEGYIRNYSNIHTIEPGVTVSFADDVYALTLKMRMEYHGTDAGGGVAGSFLLDPQLVFTMNFGV